MIDIAMISCNRRRITEVSITEIKRRTTTPHRLIVLDNGSIDDSPEMLDNLSRAGLIDKLILQEENFGVHWGHNTLLDQVESWPYYISTDNDLIPESPYEGEDWLTRLMALADNYFPEYIAIACRPHIMIGSPGNLFQDSPLVRFMWHIGAHLRIMQVDAVKMAGGWNKKSRNPSRNNEERWICKRLRELQFKVGYSRDIRCIHLFGEEEFGEDPWGYPLGIEHGHNVVSPPVNCFSWDKRGIDWETCK